jgi:hypothetical protein
MKLLTVLPTLSLGLSFFNTSIVAFQQHPNVMFTAAMNNIRQQQQQLQSSPRHFTTTTRLFSSSVPSDVSSSPYATLDDLKADLMRTCSSSNNNGRQNTKPSLANIQDLVSQLEEKAEQVGIGQSSALTGMLAGEWCVLRIA